MSYGKKFEDIERHEAVETLTQDERSERELQEIREQPMVYSDGRGVVHTNDPERQDNPQVSDEEFEEGVKPRPERAPEAAVDSNPESGSDAPEGEEEPANTNQVTTEDQ